MSASTSIATPMQTQSTAIPVQGSTGLSQDSNSLALLRNLRTYVARLTLLLVGTLVPALLPVLFPAATASAQSPATAVPAPRLLQQNGHYALLVNGKPFLVLGGQINNSSAWPATMPDVWPLMAAIHANTVEAPVYWEQMEPKPGDFDFSNVDMLVQQARAHSMHLVLLWFGTWKNGEDHYVPEWVKSNPAKYPRVIDERGEPIQVLTANSEANLDADRTAFVALMHHLAQIDRDTHTILLVQVENESGSIGAVRDHSPQANREFDGPVPQAVLEAMHKSPGSWRQVFGFAADQYFQAYSVARYINAIAAAGKKEFNIPMYCNVWLQYPRGYQIRGYLLPGFDYPSGGPVQSNIAIWKAVAPSIDMLGPDLYSSDRGFERTVMETYRRADNPLWIPETGSDNAFSAEFWEALGRGAIGFSPFGTDQTGWTFQPGDIPHSLAANYALIGPIDQEVAQLNLEGKLQTAAEELGTTEETLHFGRWNAFVGFGARQPDGEAHAPGTAHHDGHALVAQIGPDDFLVTGTNCRVTFLLAPGQVGHMQILRAEQGSYHGSEWKPQRILNGDQTDRGINFGSGIQYVQVHLGTY